MKKQSLKNLEVNKLKNLIDHEKLNKIVKGTLAIIFAGSFTFSSSTVFADQGTPENSPVAAVQSGSSSSTDGEQQKQTQEAPSLLPGDFFYFAKIVFEKIQLALTFDDVKEAKLLANFAAERLAEAEALFAAGDEEAALETIKTALENMENADNAVKEEQPAKEEVSEEQAAGEEQPAADVKDDQQTNNEPEVEEVKQVMSQNIIALTAAMEKVKNPVAKAALQKNIDKSYVKLAKKLEKWEEKAAKKQEKKAEKKKEAEQGAVEEIDTVTVDPVNGTTEETKDVERQEVSQQGSAAEEKSQHEVQAIQKAAHQEFKQSQNEAKQKQKEIREQAKEQKQMAKEQRKGSNKGHNPNGKNH